MDTSIDRIEAFAAEYLLAHHARTPRSLIVATVARYSDTPALSAAFALVSLAAHLEEPIATLEIDGALTARELYRCISAFVADICAVSLLTSAEATCGQVEAFWGISGDHFFLTATAG